MTKDHIQIGRAYLAFMAYNHKAKRNRIGEFDLKRWSRVLEAVDGKSPGVARPKGLARKKYTWSKERRARFNLTMAKRKKANGKLTSKELLS
jgi:hypothetical protein